jgi:hypothetical protein
VLSLIPRMAFHKHTSYQSITLVSFTSRRVNSHQKPLSHASSNAPLAILRECRMHPSAPPSVLLLRRYCKDLGTVCYSTYCTTYPLRLMGAPGAADRVPELQLRTKKHQQWVSTISKRMRRKGKHGRRLAVLLWGWRAQDFPLGLDSIAKVLWAGEALDGRTLACGWDHSAVSHGLVWW